MANSRCFSPLISSNSTQKPEATEKKPSTKTNSIACAECDGNGAIKCGQCQGIGINSVVHFNGQFKAGSSCWLCRISQFPPLHRLRNAQSV